MSARQATLPTQATLKARLAAGRIHDPRAFLDAGAP